MLIQCPECGHQVSDKAPTCPNCGIEIAGHTTGTTTKTMNVHVFSWNWGNTMSYGLNLEDAGSYLRTSSGSNTWGVMFPAQHMTGRQYMKSVDVYTIHTNNYTITIYQGGDNAPQTQIYSRTVKGIGEGWMTVNCSGSVPLDQTKNLWVTITASSGGGYPMTSYYDGEESYYCGDDNGCLLQYQGTWFTATSHGFPCTWAIRATTGNEPNAGISSINGAEVSVYPNPTTGMVRVDAEGLQNVEVLDMAGRTVMTASQSSFDMSSLSNGVYMLRINTAAGSAMQKIVKK